MDLSGARAFVTVVDEGSVTAAAHRLRVAQPSLSRRLQRFERDLGLVLFERSERRLVLTPGGRRFLPVARDLLARADLARETATSLREGALGSVVLSAPRTTLSDVLAPFLATWRPEDPLPHVWETPATDGYDALDRGADLVIGTTPPPRRLARLHVATLPVWAYVGPDDPWAGRAEVGVDELASSRLLVLPPQQHARLALDRAAAADGVALEHRIELSSAEVAQAVAAAGRGVAVLSDDPRFGLVPAAVRSRSGPVVIDLHAAWSPHSTAGALVEGLAARLRAFCRERYRQPHTS